MEVRFEERELVGAKGKAKKLYIVKTINPARIVNVPAEVVERQASQNDLVDFKVEYAAFKASSIKTPKKEVKEKV